MWLTKFRDGFLGQCLFEKCNLTWITANIVVISPNLNNGKYQQPKDFALEYIRSENMLQKIIYNEYLIFIKVYAITLYIPLIDIKIWD